MGLVGRVSRVGQVGQVCLAIALFLPALPDAPDLPDLRGHAAAQVPFERAAKDLTSADAETRLRAVQMLKEAAYPESAIPLARLVTDPEDTIQLEAIAAELNIFLVEKIVTRRRVALVVEVRNGVRAESAFSSGPLALGGQPIPLEVLSALRAAARDDHPRVAIEALYAFGVLAVEPSGTARRDVLQASGPVLAAFVGSPDPGIRFAAIRVLGRVFAKRAGDEPIEQAVGDAVITALNDGEHTMKSAAMQALGAMRYDRAVQALTDLFQYHGKGDAAEAALDALARIAHRSSAPLFTAQLASRDAGLRAMAIEGLARLGDRARLADVQAAVSDERSDVVRIAGLFAGAMLANQPVDAIASALATPRLRDQAWGYLLELAPGRTSSFARSLQDPDARIRADVVGVLTLSGDPAARSLVEPLASDRDPKVAQAAQRAIARLR